MQLGPSISGQGMIGTVLPVLMTGLFVYNHLIHKRLPGAPWINTISSILDFHHLNIIENRMFECEASIILAQLDIYARFSLIICEINRPNSTQHDTSH